MLSPLFRGLLVFCLPWHFGPVAGSLWAARPGEDQPAGQRIFVIGHSFTAPIGEPLTEMGKLAGMERSQLVGTLIPGGKGAQDSAEVALRAGQVDVLDMTPTAKVLPDPGMDKYADLLLKGNPNGRVMVQASWLTMDGQRGRGFKNVDRDSAVPAALRTAWAPLTNKLREEVIRLNAKYAKTSGHPVFFMVPVGEAVLRLREQVIKNEVPGIEKQSGLFKDDLGHGKPPIYVLAAYCHFAAIYGRSPVGLPEPAMLKVAGLGENTAKVNLILQQIAWEAVTAEPASGLDHDGKKL